MTWFNILFISVFGIFMLKNIISWVAGDMDLDLDLDGDIDIDVSGMLSFKGLLHFLLGFSTVLTTVGYEQTHSFVTPCSFSVATYILAVIIGIIVMVGLFYLYKFVMKLNHYSIDNPNFNNMSGKIYINEGNGQYQVLIDTPTGTFKKTVYSKDINRKNGEEITVLWDNEAKRYHFK